MRITNAHTHTRTGGDRAAAVRVQSECERASEAKQQQSFYIAGRQAGRRTANGCVKSDATATLQLLSLNLANISCFFSVLFFFLCCVCFCFVEGQRWRRRVQGCVHHLHYAACSAAFTLAAQRQCKRPHTYGFEMAKCVCVCARWLPAWCVQGLNTLLIA